MKENHGATRSSTKDGRMDKEQKLKYSGSDKFAW